MLASTLTMWHSWEDAIAFTVSFCFAPPPAADRDASDDAFREQFWCEHSNHQAQDVFALHLRRTRCARCGRDAHEPGSHALLYKRQRHGTTGPELWTTAVAPPRASSKRGSDFSVACQLPAAVEREGKNPSRHCLCAKSAERNLLVIPVVPSDFTVGRFYASPARKRPNELDSIDSCGVHLGSGRWLRPAPSSRNGHRRRLRRNRTPFKLLLTSLPAETTCTGTQRGLV
ncbi:hypothetical protein quinque_016445 [Culex quinquefasciatus]